MPEMRRQSPPPKPTPLPEGSLLANAVPVSKMGQRHVKLCIYGRNRSGKTTLAGEIARSTNAPALFISCEPDENGGADSVSDVEGVLLQRVSHVHLGQDKDGRWLNANDKRCVRRDKVKGYAKVVAIANELAGDHPFKTVVLDTVTSLQDIILVELLGLPKVPEIMSWGAVPDGTYLTRSEKLRETVRPLLALTNCNVVILAQEKDHNASEDRTGKSKILPGSAGWTMQMGSFMAPSLGATTAQWLQDNCGYVIQIYEDEVKQEVVIPQMTPDGKPAESTVQLVGTGKRQRHLRLLYHPNFAAGGRVPYSRNVPEWVTAPTPRELYAAMSVYIPALKT